MSLKLIKSFDFESKSITPVAIFNTILKNFKFGDTIRMEKDWTEGYQFHEGYYRGVFIEDGDIYVRYHLGTFNITDRANRVEIYKVD